MISQTIFLSWGNQTLDREAMKCNSDPALNQRYYNAEMEREHSTDVLTCSAWRCLLRRGSPRSLPAATSPRPGRPSRAGSLGMCRNQPFPHCKCEKKQQMSLSDPIWLHIHISAWVCHVAVDQIWRNMAEKFAMATGQGQILDLCSWQDSGWHCRFASCPHFLTMFHLPIKKSFLLLWWKNQSLQCIAWTTSWHSKPQWEDNCAVRITYLPTKYTCEKSSWK